VQRRNLTEMARLIEGAGAEIIITTPSPIVDAFHSYSLDIDYYDPWGGCNNALMEYDAPIREVADEQGLGLCDVRAAFEELALRAEFDGRIAGSTFVPRTVSTRRLRASACMPSRSTAHCARAIFCSGAALRGPRR